MKSILTPCALNWKLYLCITIDNLKVLLSFLLPEPPVQSLDGGTVERQSINTSEQMNQSLARGASTWYELESTLPSPLAWREAFHTGSDSRVNEILLRLMPVATRELKEGEYRMHSMEG